MWEGGRYRILHTCVKLIELLDQVGESNVQSAVGSLCCNKCKRFATLSFYIMLIESTTQVIHHTVADVLVYVPSVKSL